MTGFHPSSDTYPDEEIDAMADILRKRYGMVARGVAELFAHEHGKIDDRLRARLWSEVAERLPCADGSRTRH